LRKHRLILVKLLSAALVLACLAVAVQAGRSQRPQRHSVAPAAHPSFGPEEAKVVIRIFSDFGCPACRMLHAEIEEAKRKYGDRVKFTYYHYPLEGLHPWSFRAAEAAACAQDQGKFWAYYDVLYRRQNEWNPAPNAVPLFKNFADFLGLDRQAFDLCFDTGRKRGVVTADIEEGEKLNIDATPTMFINDKRVVGAPNLKILYQMIEEALGD